MFTPVAGLCRWAYMQLTKQNINYYFFIKMSALKTMAMFTPVAGLCIMQIKKQNINHS